MLESGQGLSALVGQADGSGISGPFTLRLIVCACRGAFRGVPAGCFRSGETVSELRNVSTARRSVDVSFL